MTKPAILRDALLRLLPPFSARRWAFPRDLQRRDPYLGARKIHPALRSMVKTGHAARREDESTGLYVYAKAKRNGRA